MKNTTHAANLEGGRSSLQPVYAAFTLLCLWKLMTYEMKKIIERVESAKWG
jgi:hypothetical protein